MMHLTSNGLQRIIIVVGVLGLVALQAHVAGKISIRLVRQMCALYSTGHDVLD